MPGPVVTPFFQSAMDSNAVEKSNRDGTVENFFKKIFVKAGFAGVFQSVESAAKTMVSYCGTYCHTVIAK